MEELFYFVYKKVNTSGTILFCTGAKMCVQYLNGPVFEGLIPFKMDHLDAGLVMVTALP
jgi:hypothetical protein